MNVDDLKVSVPEGRSGDWAVERFTVAPDEASMERFRAAINFGGRFVPAGTYTRLVRRGAIVMSDTPDEIRDHMWAIYQAHGHCLVNGLGLGVVLGGMLRKAGVERVTVVEIDPDVIALVAPHYIAQFGDRCEIVQADALEWAPPKGVRYGVVWHDIWNSLCWDNLADMHRLHRRYGRRADWQGSWGREYIEAH